MARSVISKLWGKQFQSGISGSCLQVDIKPASDVIAGAVARAASQSTIHPLDTLKVQLQSGKGRAIKPVLSKIGKLVPPKGKFPSARHGGMAHCSVCIWPYKDRSCA